MKLQEFISQGKFFFDLASQYVQQAQQYGIDNPIEAVFTLGYKHLEEQPTFRDNPEILVPIKQSLSRVYKNFEQNVTRDAVVVHGRRTDGRTIDQEMAED